MKLLLVSDIHGNYEALNAVTEKVEYDEALCMGDLVDYGPQPAECIDWIRNNGIPTVRGNHDNAVAFHVDCGCGYKYKHLSEATREYTWKILGEDRKEFLGSLPLKIEREFGGLSITMAHGSPSSFFDYIQPDTPAEKIEEITKDIKPGYLLLGHTHRPAIFKTATHTVLNPGSVGQPRDNDPRASCMVLDTERNKAELFCIEYDIDRTCKMIKDRMPMADELTAILRRGF